MMGWSTDVFVFHTPYNLNFKLALRVLELSWPPKNVTDSFVGSSGALAGGTDTFVGGTGISEHFVPLMKYPIS